MTVLSILAYAYFITVIVGVIYVAWKIKSFCDKEGIDEIRLKREWPQMDQQ